jgi:hypothetical protein
VLLACWFDLIGAFADEDQAGIRIDDVKFGHAVIAVEEVADAVAILEALHVLPELLDAGDFDVDFDVIAKNLHDFFGGGKLQMDGPAIALDDGIFRRLLRDVEAKHILIKGDAFVHVGDGQHRTNSSNDGCGWHR